MGVQSRTEIQAILLRHYTQVNITLIDNLSDLLALTVRKPDMVFLGMKFIPSDPALGLSDSNKIWLSEYFEREGISYTGSEQDAIELELNKELAKQRILDAGLTTARFMVIRAQDKVKRDDISLQYPLFVKPTNRGGGKGIDVGSLVYDFEQLCVKVQSLGLKLGADSLVEEYLPGREFSVGILRQQHTKKYAVMAIELVAPPDKSGARYLSKKVKSADTEYNLAVTNTELKAKVDALAIGAFHALGARDYGRIDIRLDANGMPNFLEANLLPSLLEGYGNFPKTFLLNMQLKHEDLITSIVTLAFSRKHLRQSTLTSTALEQGTDMPVDFASDLALDAI